MMKKLLAVVSLLLVAQLGAYAQLRDFEEDRLTIATPPEVVEVDAVAVPVAPGRSDKEVKYVAGKDGLWFTADDEVYHYFVVENNADGSAAKRTCFKPDGSVYDSQELAYDAQGRLSREVSYDGTGAKQYDAVYQYDSRGRKTRVVRFNPAGVEIWSMNFEYGPKGLLIKDFEYKGAGLEKWHSFEYDRKNRMARAREYKTLDGAVFAAKEFFYAKDGRKSKEHKYTGAGADNAWFTKDDVMQYYTLFEYGKAS